ncbi:MAG: host attachment family protein [Hyphomicrobiales bacterium]|uniref:baeRF12 domain-containing protein n=1 Tax=Aestuariivirga sp. TaxID=2650926 RepID=UPI0035B088D9
MKRLNHNARVLVTDGGRATVFRNAGQVGQPDLVATKSYHQDNPPNREQATDKPTRVMESVGQGRSSAEQPDYHQMTEDRFVKGIAADMAKDLGAGEFSEFIVVAPPVAMGVWRKAVNPALAKATLKEITKDLTKQSASVIADSVVKALEGD